MSAEDRILFLAGTGSASQVNQLISSAKDALGGDVSMKSHKGGNCESSYLEYDSGDCLIQTLQLYWEKMQSPACLLLILLLTDRTWIPRT